MKPCCKGFEHHFSQAGKSGISIILSSFNDKETFIMQFRAIDKGKESLINGESKVVVMTQAPVVYQKSSVA